MADDKLGISIRLIREYRPEDDTFAVQPHDLAIQLAMYPINETDTRTFAERLADAYAFITSQRGKP